MADIKVLIVDDIVVNRILIKEIIKRITTNFAEASNGKQAVELVEKEDFDVILMDIEMPVMNGIEATKYIRNKLPSPKNETPIIALTAHNPYQFFNDFKDVGFDELMTKPFSLEKVKNLITEFGTKKKS